MDESAPSPRSRTGGGEPLEARVALEELIAGLTRPAAFGLAEGPVEVIQTHISVVFLAGDRAYKVKKPARFWDLLDYGTFAMRRRWCDEEVRLNRRLAPDVYLGVEPIVRRAGELFVGGEGEVLEHAVVMRRIDERRTLGAKVARGRVTPDDVRAVAQVLAAFHRDNRLPPGPARERVAAQFAEVCRQNFDGTPVDDNTLFPPAVHRRLRRRFERRLGALRATIEARVRRGLAVDGHGDIRLDHVLESGGGWIVMDCCEFAETLRHVDPASDLAFLSMDLRAHGRADLAGLLEATYVEATGDDEAPRLFPLYRAYRAFVRATVDFHTSRRVELDAQTRAHKGERGRGYFALSWTETRRPDPAPVIVMRGTSGSGKSRVASALAPFLDAEIVRSDVVRKELLGLAPTDRPGGAERDAAYGSAMSERTYAELLLRARRAVHAGRAAILDATYLRRDSRAAAWAATRDLGAPGAIFEVTCPRETVRERLAARAARDDDASDAGWDVYLEQVASDEPLDATETQRAVRHASGTPPEPALMDLLVVLEAQLEEPPACS